HTSRHQRQSHLSDFQPCRLRFSPVRTQPLESRCVRPLLPLAKTSVTSTCWFRESEPCPADRHPFWPWGQSLSRRQSRVHSCTVPRKTFRLHLHCHTQPQWAHIPGQRESAKTLPCSCF